MVTLYFSFYYKKGINMSMQKKRVFDVISKLNNGLCTIKEAITEIYLTEPCITVDADRLVKLTEQLTETLTNGMSIRIEMLPLTSTVSPDNGLAGLSSELNTALSANSANSYFMAKSIRMLLKTIMLTRIRGEQCCMTHPILESPETSLFHKDLYDLANVTKIDESRAMHRIFILFENSRVLDVGNNMYMVSKMDGSVDRELDELYRNIFTTVPVSGSVTPAIVGGKEGYVRKDVIIHNSALDKVQENAAKVFDDKDLAIIDALVLKYRNA